MSEKLRVAAHNGRTGASGTFKAHHNDRDFNLEAAEHIDPDRSKRNRYFALGWSKPYEGGEEKPNTFEEAELAAYESMFSAGLSKRSAKQKAGGHSGRVKTMKQVLESRRTCPEETLIYIGGKNNHASPGVLWGIFTEQIRWEREKYPNVQYLDMALHLDEEGAPHIHARRVWWYTDEDGTAWIGEGRALDAMGVERPDPSKPRNKWNNPKQTYTDECRSHLQELCRSHGLEIEDEPRDVSKSGASLERYKALRAAEDARRAAVKLEDTQEELEATQNALDGVRAALVDAQEDYDYVCEILEHRNKYNAEATKAQAKCNRAQAELKQVQDELETAQRERTRIVSQIADAVQRYNEEREEELTGEQVRAAIHRRIQRIQSPYQQQQPAVTNEPEAAKEEDAPDF